MADGILPVSESFDFVILIKKTIKKMLRSKGQKS